MTWKIGDVKVTQVREQSAAVPLDVMYPNASAEEIATTLRDNADWLKPYMAEDGSWGFAVQALVIDTGKLRMIVDPCIGCHTAPGFETAPVDPQFLPDLIKAGYDSETIDYVLLTHLHYDHVGWCTRPVDGKWVPTFPNARYLMGRVEYNHWDVNADGPVWSFNDAVRPVVKAGLADFVEMDHRVCEEVWFEPTPGHSPGHITIHIASKGEHAVITGDTLHHPVQFARPHWRMFLDWDPQAAVEVRTHLRDTAAAERRRVFGTHFPGTGTGFVTATPAGSFRFDP